MADETLPVLLTKELLKEALTERLQSDLVIEVLESGRVRATVRLLWVGTVGEVPSVLSTSISETSVPPVLQIKSAIVITGFAPK
jgi:hypothetical protein